MQWTATFSVETGPDRVVTFPVEQEETVRDAISVAFEKLNESGYDTGEQVASLIRLVMA